MLDKTKQYKFKKELIEKNKGTKEPIGQWATIIDKGVVPVIEEGKRAMCQGNVIYTLAQGRREQVFETFFMEPEWVEEVI